MPGDVILMKLDVFQGKRKAKGKWSEVEYVVTCQVVSDMPTYQVRDDGRNVKVTHSNRLFLVAPARDVTMPLGGSESVSYVGAAQSALAKLTPWGKRVCFLCGCHPVCLSKTHSFGMEQRDVSQ